ncbi:MAG: sugar ABC transporter ATP-binding protein [Synergistaceae bacterium]|nr:sugar ABC transporter ATP-binding protein [Synergistaceae bacterium]
MSLPEVPLLKLENIGKDYFGNRVLADVSFTLNQGEILGLVGENGAGKSTLMNILFGMPVIANTGGYEGTFFFDGNKVEFKSPFDALDVGIGMVHQEFSLIPGFSAAENILLNREELNTSLLEQVFSSRVATLNRSAMNRRAEKAIQTLGVAIGVDTIVSEMPVGYKQFIEIAREIDRAKTRLLVLDEPTAVLTETEALILLDALRKLAESGIAIIFISHRLQEVIGLCDKLLVLRDGRIVKETAAKVGSLRLRDIAAWMVGRDVEDASVARRAVSGEREPALEVKNLWVDMPGETVRDVSFTVGRGEIFGIGGLAGQGKLGIPNGIMGLSPSGGSVNLFGKPIELNAPRNALDSKMAFVSEDRRGVGLLLEERIDWNITFTAMQVQSRFLKNAPVLGALLRLRDDAAIAEETQRYIEALEIKCTGPGQRAVELSGGNQQKVCLAKAFALKPDLLLICEPTRGIDVGAKELVLGTLRRYNEEYGTTILVTSSELEELRSVCDRVAIVEKGRIAGILPASRPAEEFGVLMMGEALEEDRPQEKAGDSRV